MLGFLRYFKKAAKLAGKAKRPGAPGEPGEKIDRSIYRIGVFGHKGVGKTVFLTAVYAFARDSSELQLLAMGESQAYLEGNLNTMKGRSGDRSADGEVEIRRFPETSSAVKKLGFSAQLGKTINASLETMDYSGKDVYLDSAEGMPQNLMDFFQLCDCVLFLIDPDAANNKVELTRRVTSFTRLIEQLSDSRKRLNIPIGLVITKADELQGFKSGLQSTLVGRGAGYIKGLRFNDFVSAVDKQPYLADFPEWKKTLREVLGRFQLLFDPLVRNTLDFQVFFISSTGGSPLDKGDGSGDVHKAPPKDFRPLGVNQPIMWALRRIRACRRAAVFNAISKWLAFTSLLIILIVFSLNIYNKAKVDSLAHSVSDLKLDGLEAYSSLAAAFSTYSDNFIVRLFFGNFRRVSLEKYNTFAGVSSDDWMRGQFEQFDIAKDSAAVLLNIADDPGSDTVTYKAALSSLRSLLGMAEDLERSVRTQGYSTSWMTADLRTWREALDNMPSAEDHAKISGLLSEYENLKQDLGESLDGRKFDYLLNLTDPDNLPGKLSQLKAKLDENADTPGIEKYIRRVENYIDRAGSIDKSGSYVYFTVSGADQTSNGYYIMFGQQPGFPEGELDVTSRERIRVPAKNDVEIKLYDVNTAVAIDNCIIPSGFEILSWDNRKLCFRNPNLSIKLRFDLDELESSLRNVL
jgi:hypothetical protein